MYMDKTLREMLENPLVSEIAPDAISKWDLSGEEFWNWTLQEIADKMGWNCLERGFMSLYTAAGRGKYYWKLYSEEECAAEPAKEGRNLVWFPSEDICECMEPDGGLAGGQAFQRTGISCVHPDLPGRG